MVLQKPPECDGCPLRHIGEGFAWGDGNPQSDIWLVGEALGDHEREEGKPFVGGSGRYLNRMLQKAGLRRDQCYLTNIVRCQPPGNEIWPWLPKAADHCSQYMDRDFSAHRPKIIVAVGGTALARFTPFRGGIYAARGYIFNNAPLPGIRTIGTLHPAELIRAANVREKKQGRHREAHESVVIADLRKAKLELAIHEPFTPEIEIIRTPDRLERWIAGSRSDHVTVDIETTGLGPDNVIICIGLGVRRRGACVVLVDETGQRGMSEADELRALRALSDLFTDGSIVKVFHNGYSFDIPELIRRGFTFNNWADTMIMHHTKYAELPHKLRFLGSIYTRMSPWKGEAKEAMEEELDK